MRTIRAMDMSDVPFVYHAEVKVFGESLNEAMLYDELIYNKMAHYFMVLDEGQRAGYIGCWITEPNAEILNFLVLEEYRGKSHGKALIDYVIEYCRARDVESLTLEVRPSNTHALSLYKAVGFKEVSRRKQYYKNGEDALLMQKHLGGLM